MLSFHLLYIVLVTSTTSSLLSTYGLDYVIDPLNSVSHGLMLSPARVVLELDCPGFPVYDHSWNSNATALVRIRCPCDWLC